MALVYGVGDGQAKQAEKQYKNHSCSRLLYNRWSLI